MHRIGSHVNRAGYALAHGKGQGFATTSSGVALPSVVYSTSSYGRLLAFRAMSEVSYGAGDGPLGSSSHRIDDGTPAL